LLQNALDTIAADELLTTSNNRPTGLLVPGLERQSFHIESIGALSILVEHDLFGKPASTFPDHALSAGRVPSNGCPRAPAAAFTLFIAPSSYGADRKRPMPVVRADRGSLQQRRPRQAQNAQAK
jgi:hypothetical protein